MYDFERNLEAKHTRRLKAEDRYLTRLEAKEAKAEALVGELVRNGETVYYINLSDRAGRPTGKTLENASSYPLVEYLIRNHYV